MFELVACPLDKEPTIEAVLPNRGSKKKWNVEYVYKALHPIIETIVNQNNMFVSDIEDSDFEPQMQISDDQDAGSTSEEEIIVSSDQESKNK